LLEVKGALSLYLLLGYIFENNNLLRPCNHQSQKCIHTSNTVTEKYIVFGVCFWKTKARLITKGSSKGKAIPLHAMEALGGEEV
jgi:hypothetical protein